MDFLAHLIYGLGMDLGKFLIFAGSALIAIGLVLTFRDQIPFLKYLGRLPGDIAIRRENFSLYFPLATSLLLSVLLSLILYLFRR